MHKNGRETKMPQHSLDVLGGFKLRGNAFIDSLLTAGNLIVNDNTQLNGLLNIGSALTLDGVNGSITSSAGSIDFLNSSLLTTGNIMADTVTANVLTADTGNVMNYVCDVLEVTRESVRRWKDQFRQYGLQGVLKEKKVGKISKLNEDKKRRISENCKKIT